MDEQLYAKGYNHAEFLCNNMPEILKGITTPDNEPSDYTLGFQDRVKEYEREQSMIKNFSPTVFLDPKSKQELDKDKDKGPDMDR